MSEYSFNKKQLKKYYGKGPFESIRYCIRCCLPDTQEGTSFDEMGICPSCQSSEIKMGIDWVEREKSLRNHLEKAREQGRKRQTWDVMVPISGGKDSCFQLHILKKIYKMNILAVTFNQNWQAEIGKYNLSNILKKLNIDHMMFTQNHESINKIARESLYQIGDACWHCHSGVGAYPLQIAVKYKIPLLVWGESVAERTGRATHLNPIHFDRDYFTKISAKKYPEEMINERSGLTWQDLLPYQLPSSDEMNEIGVYGIHLGDYYFWDEMRQEEFLVKEYDWKEDDIDNAYKRYKGVECRLTSVHDYAKFVKRGYGRVTDQASDDIRQGLMIRKEGMKIIADLDGVRPDSLDEYLEKTGFTEEEFHEILEGLREGNAKKLPKYKDRKND